MKHLFFLGVLLLTQACRDEDPLHPVCDEVCAIGPDGNTYTGDQAYGITCHTGKMECHLLSNGSYSDPVCTGSWLPQTEQCPFDPYTGVRKDSVAGIDFDCNGVPNDLVIPAFELTNPCSSTQEGVCQASSYECRNGQMVCVPPPDLYKPVQDCSILDVNCKDGLNDVPNDTTYIYPDEQYPNTVGNGNCRPEIMRCVNGVDTVVQTMITPQAPGNSCNEDLNCDGVPDGGKDSATVLMLDVSDTLMYNFLFGVQSFLCGEQYQAQFSNSQFAIVLVAVANCPDLSSSGFGVYQNSACLQKLTDFVSMQDACQIFSNWHATAVLDGYSEFFALAVDELNKPSDDNLQVSWPANLSKQVVMASDEDPMPYGTLDPAAGNQQVAEDCAAYGFTTGVFTAFYAEQQWAPFTAGACSGWMDTMVDDQQEMADKLAAKINTCR